MQKLFIVWTCYLLVIFLYTNNSHHQRQKHLPYFCLLHTKGKVFPLLEGLESSFWSKNVVEFNFQSTGAHYRCGGRRLTVERSPFVDASQKKYWFYYPHRWRDFVSPVCGIFKSHSTKGRTGGSD